MIYQRITTNNYNHTVKKYSMSENAVFPGDKLASIEEYEAGYNTFDDGDLVRAATVGKKNIDKSTRIVEIQHPRILSIPKIGDIIIGTVASSYVFYDSSIN